MVRVDEGREGRVQALVRRPGRLADSGAVVGRQGMAFPREQQVMDRGEEDERVLERRPREEEQARPIWILGQPGADQAVAIRSLAREVARPDAEVVEQRAEAVGIRPFHQGWGLSRLVDGW